MDIPVNQDDEYPDDRSLAELWAKPAHLLPELWPEHALQQITDTPNGWLTVAESFYSANWDAGRRCILIHPGSEAAALEEIDWIGRNLGVVSIYDEHGFEDGLTSSDDVTSEFFIHVRKPPGALLPFAEIAHPFLWHWSAYPVENGWKYLDAADHEHDLIRWEMTEQAWKVEVQASELRQYLTARGRTALVQVDYVTRIDHDPVERIDIEFASGWTHLGFHSRHEPMLANRPLLSRLWGQYLVAGRQDS
jgi:hypothetical protein